MYAMRLPTSSWLNEYAGIGLAASNPATMVAEGSRIDSVRKDSSATTVVPSARLTCEPKSPSQVGPTNAAPLME